MKINPTTFPVSWFRDRSVDGTLVLKPPYQRKPVWRKNQKAYLMDTVIKELQVPEVYIHRVSQKGASVYSVVDGQQRIRTILEFVDNQFALDGDFTPEFPDMTFSELPEKVKESIWGYVLYVREISNATEDEVRQFFMRMNRNVVSLNSQELRHATFSGDFIKLMEEIAEDPFWTENKIVSPSEVRRMNDVQYVSELFVSMMNGVQDKAKELDNFYEKYEKLFGEKASWHERFMIIKVFIAELIPDMRNVRWRNKADFYSLFMALNEILGKRKNFFMTSPKRKALSKELVAFANDVDAIVSKEEAGKSANKTKKTYAGAVAKHTTDKKSRLIRHKILVRLLGKHVSK